MSMNHKTVTSPPWPYSYLVTSPESLAKDHDSQEYSTPGQNWPQFCPYYQPTKNVKM